MPSNKSFDGHMTILKFHKLCNSISGHQETWFEMRLYDCLCLSSDRIRIVEPYGLYESSEFIELADLLAENNQRVKQHDF
jgi:hypothetical protein